MQFTYDAYSGLIDKIWTNRYSIADYHDYTEYDRCVILRHDIDTSIGKAVRLAALEAEKGVKSTYFVLLTSDFYNVFSRKSRNELKKILEYGHEIGLHFDETCYSEICGDIKRLILLIKQEAEILENAIDQPVTTVSMHRPSKEVLEADLEIPGMINSYGQIFFHDFKYLSDSRRNWREPVEDIIISGEYKKLHILTHAFWYGDVNVDLNETVSSFVKSGNTDRWDILNDNFTELKEVMCRDKTL